MINNIFYKESLTKVLYCVESYDKTYLITGATGLIGSCLIDLIMLANEEGRNNRVYAMGRSKEKLERRFSAYLSNDNFYILEQDVCEPLSDCLQIDYIIHGASNADPVSYAKYPVETMKTNILGTYNILEYGKVHKDCKITILSTFEVYGNANKDVYTEGDIGVLDFNVLRSCYPESKRSVEVLSRCYADEYGVNVNVARLSSVYGPTMAVNDSKAHAQFLSNALQGRDIVLKSEGLPRRSYTYVLDAVTGILVVLYRGAVAESYNVSNDSATASIAEVAKIVAEIASLKVVFDLPTELEAKGFSRPQNSILDNSKLKSLNWKGEYSVKNGMKLTYDILSSF